MSRNIFLERDMLFDRRTLIAGAMLSAGFDRLAGAQPMGPDSDYKEYDFDDYFAESRGPVKDLNASDLEKVGEIIASLPKDAPISIAEALAALPDVGSTGEKFNSRWKTIGNPLLVKFFHDIGYRKTPMPGDCTAWCAATVSWCLQRVGKDLPRDPASSQSFLRYGKKVDNPQRGDICVFTDLDDAAHGHVGFYYGRGADGVRVLGGNQSGRSTTGCGPGYRQSRIDASSYAINPTKDPKVAGKFLAAFVRP
jgi:uncharacterized protein (TIGR02594 family)